MSVDGGGSYGLGQTRGQPGGAPDIEGLLADLGDAAGDDLLDGAAVDTGTPQELREDRGEEPRGMNTAQGAVAARQWGAERVNDQHLFHC